jgi:hypothetical protein
VRWVKRGLIYQPAGQFHWNKSHAQLPIVDAAHERKWRIYFATRGADNRSNISYIEVEAGRPENILYEHDRPLLPLGALGAFDESGLMPVCFVRQQGRQYLFYAGWSLKQTVPYHNAVGLALSTDDGRTFTKFAPGPIFDLRPHEPYFTGTANVLIEDGVWRVWYQSCTRWALIAGRPEPFYHLKYAESTDGINWARQGVVAIDYKDDMEGGISSASVVREAGLYSMWYSYRGAAGYREHKAHSYRIGYAESPDGIVWTRKDAEAGIDVSPAGWDSEMIAYPYVLRYGDERFMFYNGNGFGRTGFGYAVAAIGALTPPAGQKGR